jgi:hypothetical protein
MTIQLGFNSPAAGARVGQNFTVTGFAFDDGRPMGGDPPNGRIATTGTFTFAITATDALGHTGAASGSVNLHL